MAIAYEDVIGPMDIQQRLRERAQCEAAHPISTRVPHNGLGWTGTRCPKCGFMFFGEWEDWTKLVVDGEPSRHD